MYRNQTAITLRETLAQSRTPEAILRDAVTHERLRQQVFAVVDDLKQLDWPPERVIIAVKQIARDSGLYPSIEFTRVGTSLSNGDALLAHMVRWSIDRYYLSA